MKLSFFNKATLLLACILSSQGISLADAQDKDQPKLVLEPLSLTISKSHGDLFGQGMNPMSMFTREPASGTKLLVKVTLDPDFKALHLSSEAKLRSFRDDQGTDLLKGPKAKNRNMFQTNLGNLSVVQSRKGGPFGLELRAPKTPAPTAKALTVAGTLLFAPANSEIEDGHAKLVLEDGKVVKVGPVRLKFTMPRAEGSWYVQMLPDPEVTNPSILIFGADEDVAIFNSRSGNRITRVFRKPGKDPFNGIVARGFRCPGDKISRIRIRSYQRRRLIEVPFELKTGLGLSGGPQIKPGKKEREPDQTAKITSPHAAGFPVNNEGPRRAVR